MGIISSKIVTPKDSEMPAKTCNCKPESQKQRLKQAHQRQRRKFVKATTSAPFSAGPVESQTSMVNMTCKKPSVWIVTKNVEPEPAYPQNYFARRRRDDGDSILVLDQLSEHFAELEALAENFANDESARMKVRRFLIAWKAGLSYTSSKMTKLKSDIPLAATSEFTERISRCQRLRRKCLVCSADSPEDHHLEADLHHKVSLLKFYAKLDEMETESVGSDVPVLPKRLEMYDCLHPSALEPPKKPEPVSDRIVPPAQLHHSTPMEYVPEQIVHLLERERAIIENIDHHLHHKENNLENHPHHTEKNTDNHPHHTEKDIENHPHPHHPEKNMDNDHHHTEKNIHPETTHEKKTVQ